MQNLTNSKNEMNNKTFTDLKDVMPKLMVLTAIEQIKYYDEYLNVVWDEFINSKYTDIYKDILKNDSLVKFLVNFNPISNIVYSVEHIRKDIKSILDRHLEYFGYYLTENDRFCREKTVDKLHELLKEEFSSYSILEKKYGYMNFTIRDSFGIVKRIQVDIKENVYIATLNDDEVFEFGTDGLLLTFIVSNINNTTCYEDLLKIYEKRTTSPKDIIVDLEDLDDNVC